MENNKPNTTITFMPRRMCSSREKPRNKEIFINFLSAPSKMMLGSFKGNSFTRKL